MWERKLSERALGMKGSEIRRLFRLSMRPGVISFAGGLPDPGSFPKEEASHVLSRLLRERGEVLLQYGPARGDEKLVEAIRERIKRRGMEVGPREVLIVSGAQQGLDLCAKLFVNPGDVVLVEAPTFIGALGAFRNYQARMVGVPMEEDGVDLGALEDTVRALGREGIRPKFFYTIPNFQNPTGILTSQEKRRGVLELARKYDFLIVEDDAYGELGFGAAEADVRSIKAQDEEGRVLYLGSFSKIVSPGIRLGWVAGPEPLIDRFEMAKQMLDVCPNPLIQAMVVELSKDGFLDGHVRRLWEIYRSRRDAMVSALRGHMPESVRWTEPSGGFYLWVTLPDGRDAIDLFHMAVKRKVAFVIGSAFYPDESVRNVFRLSFCHEPEEVIEEGIERLGEATQAFLAR
ncbi:MAG TPA: PLP-dependent aminotransferase family protein [Candidatus Latescibacteria bacterium]|nr:PLP-dependent aminotransferase family protein [Candidatus Latescibacterota bacterium]